MTSQDPTLRRPPLSHVAGVLLLLVLSSSCATRYVEQPTPSTAEDAVAELAPALASLLGSPDTSVFIFCEAEPDTGECEDVDDGLSALGVGGYALPLLMDLSEMSVQGVTRTEEGWTLKSRFRTRVNGIPPICGRAKGTLRVNDAGTANIEYDRFYCNWVLIGNVLTKVELSIDSVDLEARTFRGYYAVTFNGTGNAGGSGYFRASPKKPEES